MPVLSPRRFHEIVSGRDHSLVGRCWRCCFAVVEPLYQWIVARRNRAFDNGKRTVESVPAIVISVGNLTVGGTGKTPLVRWLVEHYQRIGHPVAIVSRGYGKTGTGPNDEARELAIHLPEIPHEQDRRRIDAARRALAKLPTSSLPPVIILDDAMQHRQIARSLDIVLLDATCPFGYDHLLPRGLLREPVDSLKRAHIIALSRASSVSDEERQQMKDRALSYNPNATWVELSHEPRTLIDCENNRQPVDTLKGKKVFGFCGIGNPAAFRKTLESLGAELTAFEIFPDHANYDQLLLAQLERSIQAQSQTPDLILCTLKDLVKIPHHQLADIRLFALSIDLVITSGEEAFKHALMQLVPCRSDTLSGT